MTYSTHTQTTYTHRGHLLLLGIELVLIIQTTRVLIYRCEQQRFLIILCPQTSHGQVARMLLHWLNVTILQLTDHMLIEHRILLLLLCIFPVRGRAHAFGRGALLQ